MTFSEFLELTHSDSPPGAISKYLLAMWHERKGNWTTSHEIVQGIDSTIAARIHAYLHRVEGDLWNADYWYRRAHISRPETSLETEWQDIVKALLSAGS